MTTDEIIQRLKCYPTGLMKTEVYAIIAKLEAAEVMAKAIQDDQYCSFHTDWAAHHYNNAGKDNK